MYGTELLAEVATQKTSKPTNLEFIYYFFWEKGIDYNAFNQLPIPYILGILNAVRYVKEEEEKQMKKSQKKK